MVIAAAGTVPKAKMANCPPPGRFAADGCAMEDLATVGCCSHAAAVLGPPVVVHELIAVTTHPRLTIVAHPPEPANERAARCLARRRRGQSLTATSANCSPWICPSVSKSRQKVSGSRCMSTGTGWRYKVDAFCHVILRITSEGRSPICSWTVSWVCGQVESQWG
jgi:hypothetical protein